MSTTFYAQVPIARQHGIGNGQVSFTWIKKIPKLLELLHDPSGFIVDEYGQTYSLEQFLKEVDKGVEEGNSECEYI